MNFRNYSRCYNEVMGRKASNPNPAKTFAAWQKDAALTREALKLVNRMFEEDRAKAFEEYSTNRATEMVTALREDYEECVGAAKRSVKERLDEVVSSKRDAISKACKAPTEEDLRLLQALSMRAKLTDTDVIYAAEQIGSNLNSLAVLHDLAESRGVDIPIPTAAEYEGKLNDAVAFANDMVRQLNSPDKEMTYNAVCFYDYANLTNGPAVHAFRELDESAFTAEEIKAKIETARVNTSAIANGKSNASSVLLKEGDSLANIALQFGVKMSDIEKANPSLNLSDLHAGDCVLIPSSKFKAYDGEGFASPSQVTIVQTGKAEQ